MSSKIKLNPISAAMTTAFAVSVSLSGTVNAEANPFAANQLSSGYMVAEAGVAGAALDAATGAAQDAATNAVKEAATNAVTGAVESATGTATTEQCAAGDKDCCKDNKCAEGTCGADHMKSKATEGKCGEGKCGASKTPASTEAKAEEGKCGGNN